MAKPVVNAYPQQPRGGDATCWSAKKVMIGGIVAEELTSSRGRKDIQRPAAGSGRRACEAEGVERMMLPNMTRMKGHSWQKGGGEV